MTPHDAFRELLLGLQHAYANEGTPGGTEAAIALGEAVTRLADTPIEVTETDPCWLEALDFGSHPLAVPLRIAAPLIPWMHAGLEDGKIAPEVARQMLTAELVGPDGPLRDDRVRVGLFFQARNVDYPVRTHAAEETYIMLAGEGGWSLDHAEHTIRQPGDVILHPSFAPHASRTGARPMLAAWRWGGDISWESYRCA